MGTMLLHLDGAPHIHAGDFLLTLAVATLIVVVIRRLRRAK